MSGKAKPRTGVTAHQTHDSKTGRPLIETVMAYELERVPPPKLKPKPKKLNHPMPWKDKENGVDARLAALRSGVRDIAAGKAPAAKPSAQRPAARAQVAPTSAQGTSSGTPRVRSGSRVFNNEGPQGDSPLKLGTMRVLEVRDAHSMCRELPAKAHLNSNVRPIGSISEQPSGVRPRTRTGETPTEGPEEVYDCVMGVVKPKPVVSPERRRQLQEPETNVLGAEINPQKTAAPRTRLVEMVKAEQEADQIAREHEHYGKVMQRTKLVQMVKAEQAAHGATAANHIDPDAKVDIFGKPLLPGADVPPNPVRKKMFPTDKERVYLFGNAPAAHSQCKSAPKPTGLPDYIAFPPASSAPHMNDGQKPNEQEDPFSIPSMGAKPAPKVPSFYSASWYRQMLARCKGWGVRPVRMALRAADKDADGILTRHELRNALLKFGLEYDDKEIAAIIQLATVNPAAKKAAPRPKLSAAAPPKGAAQDAPCIIIPGLVDTLRRELSNRRRQAIVEAYQAACGMASREIGEITLDELEAVMSFQHHPTFEPHVRGSMREVTKRFGEAWGRKARHAVVTDVEFMGFFHDVSASFNTDADFVKMMKAVFNLR